MQITPVKVEILDRIESRLMARVAYHRQQIDRLSRSHLSESCREASWEPFPEDAFVDHVARYAVLEGRLARARRALRAS